MLKMLLLELKQTYRQYFLSFAIYLMACVILPFIPVLKLKGFLVVFIVIAFTIFIGVLFFNIFIQFYRSMFGSVGYLYQTLPLTVHELLISKIIATFIWLVVGMFILIAGLLIMVSCLALSAQAPIQLFLPQINWAFLAAHWQETLTVLLFLVVSTVSQIIQAFTLCTVVQTKYTRKHRILWMVIIAFVVMMIWIIFNYTVYDVYDVTFMNLTTLEQLWWSILFQVVTSGLLYTLDVYILEKKLEF